VGRNIKIPLRQEFIRVAKPFIGSALFIKSILIGIVSDQNTKQESNNSGGSHDNQYRPEHFWEKVVQNNDFPYSKNGNHRKDEDKHGEEIGNCSFN